MTVVMLALVPLDIRVGVARALQPMTLLVPPCPSHALALTQGCAQLAFQSLVLTLSSDDALRTAAAISIALTLLCFCVSICAFAGALSAIDRPLDSGNRAFQAADCERLSQHDVALAEEQGERVVEPYACVRAPSSI